MLHYAMRQVVSSGASDLHLKAGSPPYVRLNGELQPIPGMYALADEEMDKIVRELARHAPMRLREFEHAGESDLAYELRQCARFRVNIFRQRGKISVALRTIPDAVPCLRDLNLPGIIETLAMVPRGLILLTGATGSGKTTTLAGMIDHINEHTARHIVTIEDPIEIVHRDKKSLVNQREVGLDTGSFSGALRRALRQDPDVILIGEMRDEETVRTALSAAETGHLVLSTLHTIDVMETIYRILDFFPAELQRQARNMLAGTLKGIISQRLVQTKDGRSRVPAVEVLVGTSRVADCILRAEDTQHIHDAVAEGGYYGMQSFDQALLQMVVNDHVTIEEAMYHASSKQNFALLLEAHSIRLDKDLRKRASGSVTSPQDEVGYDESRRGRPTADTYPSVGEGILTHGLGQHGQFPTHPAAGGPGSGLHAVPYPSPQIHHPGPAYVQPVHGHPVQGHPQSGHLGHPPQGPPGQPPVPPRMPPTPDRAPPAPDDSRYGAA